jgi:endoglucanase
MADHNQPPSHHTGEPDFELNPTRPEDAPVEGAANGEQSGNMDEVYESAPWLFAMLRKRFNNNDGATAPTAEGGEGGEYQTLGSPLLISNASGPVVEHPDGSTEAPGAHGPEISEIQDDGTGLGGNNFDFNGTRGGAPQGAPASSFEMFLPKKTRPTGNNEDLFGSGVPSMPENVSFGQVDDQYSVMKRGLSHSDWSRLQDEDDILPGATTTPFPFGAAAGAGAAAAAARGMHEGPPGAPGPDMDRLAARVLEMLNNDPGYGKKKGAAFGGNDEDDHFSKGGIQLGPGKAGKFDKYDDEADMGLMKPPWDISEYHGDTVYPFNAGHDPDRAVFDEEEGLIPPHFRKIIRVRWLGLFIFIMYLLAFVFYVWWRAEYTLSLGGNTWYGIMVLCAEVLGAFAMIPYGLALVIKVQNDTPWSEMDSKLLPETTLRYHVRVLIPCYKEPVDVISKTMLAALHAPLPEGCQKSIYLCDDGKDPEKKKFCHSLNRSNVIYVSGRDRKKGEMNGKSNNINNVCRLLYPAGLEIPLSESIALFDADQVANPDFFIKMVPLLDGGADVAMVLSPQTFYNLNPEGDIFNHGNTHFWHYIQPGYDAWGVISCTGTNFLMRSRAFMQVGGFPDDTLTEDFALGIELKRYNWQCRYVNEYLAVGEAPEAVRNCFQQRSRWSKGHFQLFFSRKCPIFRSRLSIAMRIMYGGVIVAYFSCIIVTPLLIVVPWITIWIGTFPIIINWHAATAVTVYFIISACLAYFVVNLGHLKALWFAQIANAIMWFAFLKAFIRTTVGKLISGNIVFKATIKGLQKMVDSALRDVWMAAVIVAGNISANIVGIIHLSKGNLNSPLIISLLWCVYNTVPQGLLLWYAFFPHGGQWKRVFNWMCKLGMLIQWATALAAVVLIWPMLPPVYEPEDAMTDTLYFYESQFTGRMPPNYNVNYRGDSHLQDAVANACDVGWIFQRNRTRDMYANYDMAVGPGFANLTSCAYQMNLLGGFITNFGLGNIKMTLPIAWATTMLSWGLLTFRSAYDEAGATERTKNIIRWGAEYLMKAYVNETTFGSSTIFLVARVGNVTYEKDYWGRPERQDYRRPAFAITMQQGASDLGGQVAAALAASSMALGDSDPLLAQALLREGRNVWRYANFTKSKWTDWDIQSRAFYGSNSFWDDLAWGAAWLYRASKDPVFLSNYFFAEILHLKKENKDDAEFLFDTDKVYWGTNMLMAQLSDSNNPTFQNQTATFLKNWVCPGYGRKAQYTTYGRAFHPEFTSLHETTNVVFLATMYADLIKESAPDHSQVYKCWALSQLRYVLGDSGKSFIVGYGEKPPQRTQDRAAACPNPPEACNVLTSLYSSKADSHEIIGALVQGPGGQDEFVDVRSSDSARVGIEMNAALTGALAGIKNYPEGLWQICLQTYGVIRWNPVCGVSTILQKG